MVLKHAKQVLRASTLYLLHHTQLLSPEPTAMFQKAGMLAPDGRCKTLDAAADGYVRAEAVGALVLGLAAASYAASRGSFSALLSGSSVNQDGRSSSLTGGPCVLLYAAWCTAAGS